MKCNTFSLIILAALLLNCQQLNKQNTIDFEFVSGVLIVNGKVGDSIQGIFQLDTGANNSFIRKKIADKLNIVPSGMVKGPGPGGKIFEVPTAEIESISIGGNTTTLSACAIMDLGNQKVPESFIGLIGSDYLKNFVVTLDFKRSVLVFEDTQSLNTRLLAGTKIPIKVNKNAPNIPYMNVCINDSLSGDYIFDTGVPTTHLIYEDFLALGLNKDMKEIKKKSQDILKSHFETYETTIASFGLNDSLTIHNLEIATCENCNGLIGNNFISNFLVTLNYKEKYALFKKVR